MTEIMVINRIFHQAHKKQAQNMAKNSRVGETHKKKTGFLPLKNLEFRPILPSTSQPVNKHINKTKWCPGDSSRDPFIPKRWVGHNSPFKGSCELTIPKRSRSQNCRGENFFPCFHQLSHPVTRLMGSRD